MKLDVVDLTKDLVSYKSDSSLSNVPVTEHVIDILDRIGFEVERLPYTDASGVDKLCVVARLGKGAGGLSLLSHDDVVPARQEQGWTDDPYQVRTAKGKLFGRGVCDMKGPLAATLCAAASIDPGRLQRPLFIVVTADEEVQAVGAWHVVRTSRLFADAASGYGVICEPTRLKVVYAHKGSLHIRAVARGRAAHTSTLKGDNANLKMIPFLVEMKKLNERALSSKRYRNDEFEPPCSEWSIGINDHNPATNISPVQSVCTISYRPMPHTDAASLVEATRAAADRHGIGLEVHETGKPVYTDPEAAIVRTALTVTGTRKPRTVAYGTDGLAFQQQMRDLVVVGPGDIAQAHIVDEWVEVDQLRKGVDTYRRFIDHVCVEGRD